MNLFFDYTLPENRIAQSAIEPRDHSRLMVVGRQTSHLDHRRFFELPDLLRSGDLLVVNDTRVLAARLIGRRAQTGGRWEGLFLQENDGLWEMLAQTRGFVQPGERCLTDTGLSLELVARTSDRHWLMRPETPGAVPELLARYGTIPLPPYIRRGLADTTDTERYQTVYAQEAGSVAAPTAGLHFTDQLFDRLKNKGIERATITLHVGYGTFATIQTDDPLQHRIHAEYCTVSSSTVQAIEDCRRRGGRVIAVGTTSTRALETAFRESPKPYQGQSSLFIHPPFEFRAIDGMITNFHLPRTSLLLLVQSLCGPERLRSAYESAISEGYRFYSYGDAMLVI